MFYILLKICSYNLECLMDVMYFPCFADVKPQHFNEYGR